MVAGHPIDIPVTISNDGAIELEGVEYRDDAALKAKIAEINERRPAPRLHIKAPTDRTIRFEVVGVAIRKLQQAGAHLAVGFVTAPRKD